MQDHIFPLIIYIPGVVLGADGTTMYRCHANHPSIVVCSSTSLIILSRLPYSLKQESITKFKLLRLTLSDSHSSTFSDLINQSPSMASVEIMLRFKEKDRDKKNKKSGFHCGMDEVSVELLSTEDNPRENNCRKVFVISSKYDNLHS